MMSALEREIIEKFHQLDKAAQKRVRDHIIQLDKHAVFDYDAWFREVEVLRQEIEPFNAIELLEHMRH